MKILQRAKIPNNSGQAMVETALIIFFLVVLVFGMTEFGRAMYTKNTLNNAARAGARAGVVTPGITDTGPITANGPVQVASNCTTYGTSLSPCTGNNCIYQAVCNTVVAGIQRPMNVSVQIFDPTGTNPGQSPVSGTQVQVTVQASFTPALALMQNMISSTLSGQATMRYE